MLFIPTKYKENSRALLKFRPIPSIHNSTILIICITTCIHDLCTLKVWTKLKDTLDTTKRTFRPKKKKESHLSVVILKTLTTIPNLKTNFETLTNIGDNFWVLYINRYMHFLFTHKVRTKFKDTCHIPSHPSIRKLSPAGIVSRSALDPAL